MWRRLIAGGSDEEIVRALPTLAEESPEVADQARATPCQSEGSLQAESHRQVVEHVDRSSIERCRSEPPPRDGFERRLIEAHR